MAKIITIVILLAIAAGAIFLMTWDIPAPEKQVSKTLNDDRFPG